ncbi:MAG: nucleotide exchange factor GrpE [Thermodesulfobacteriota bacterium]
MSKRDNVKETQDVGLEADEVPEPEEVLEPEAVEEDAAAQEEVEEGDTVEKLKDELAAEKDKFLRKAAEFENYKRRLERERATALKYAEENVLKELLPVVDNLERALEHFEDDRDNPDIKEFYEGVELTYKGLMTTLEKFGVKPIESVGEPFDPNRHEALTMEETSEAGHNTVYREYQKGYVYKERLLRPAKVVVARNE